MGFHRTAAFVPLFGALIWACCLDSHAEAQRKGAAPAWAPQRTWLFFVGLLEWKNPTWSPFPQENRRDEQLLSVLRRRGVPEEQIVYLKDSRATADAIQSEFAAFLKKPKPGDWAFVYFCGHGYNTPDRRFTYLVSYDASTENPGWRVDQIPAAIERNFRGSHAIVALDNCCSGAMADAVKGLAAPRVSYGVFASAHHNSGSTGNWTFTENLIYAFEGRNFMDDDGDRAVTFAELAANVREDMTFAENQMPQIAMTGRFDRGAVISAASEVAAPGVGKRVEILSEGTWYPGFVTQVEGEKSKIHYYGYDVSDDEWVTADRLREPNKKTFPVGAKVEVESSKEWYRAKILTVRAGLHFVEYDGWGPKWNEWIPAGRIRQ